MKVGYFSLKDAKTGYLGLFAAKTEGEAKRMIALNVADDTTIIGKFAKDYTLYKIGIFDDATGKWVEDHRVICEVSELKEN